MCYDSLLKHFFNSIQLPEYMYIFVCVRSISMTVFWIIFYLQQTYILLRMFFFIDVWMYWLSKVFTHGLDFCNFEEVSQLVLLLQNICTFLNNAETKPHWVCHFVCICISYTVIYLLLDLCGVCQVLYLLIFLVLVASMYLVQFGVSTSLWHASHKPS